MAHSGIDEVTDRLQNELSCNKDKEKDKDSDNVINNNKNDNKNKPDFQELDLGSPVSPLRPKSQQGGLVTSTTTTSSSSSSSGSVSGRRSGLGIVSGSGQLLGRRSESRDHSGELSAESSPAGAPSGGGSGSVFGSGSGSGGGSSRSGHVRGDSGGTHSLSGGGGSSNVVNSPGVAVLPAGNICPSGRVLKTGMMSNRTSKTDVLGSGGVNYGHGSIMRGGVGGRAGGGSDGGHGVDRAARSGGGLMVGGESRSRMRQTSKDNDPEEFKRLGNESYLKGNYTEALSLYDKAIAISPGNATLHFNRAASLMGLKRLPQAVKECEEAIRLNPGYVRAHKRLGSLFLSLGQVENARRQFSFPGIQVDPNEMQKLQIVETHIGKCSDARRVHDWGSVLREIDAAIASGADSSPQLFACRAEALLKLHRVDDASLSLSDVPKFEAATASHSQSKFHGMLSEAYLLVVGAQIELARGRFDNAVTTADKAAQIDPQNREVSGLLRNVRLVARARARGNDLFKSERFTEACSAYEEGLKQDPSNSVLYCNRAACWYKLGLWERSLEDCDQALRLHPNYSKALLRRAASYSKLERWAEAVKDYEVLKKETPYDSEIAEQLFHARVALRKSRGEDVSNMKFGGEVELVLGLEQFRAAVSSPIASVVHFKTASDTKCKQLARHLDVLCSRYPSVNFLKVDVDESQAIANSENVKIVPTVKIYKSGNRVKEMVCPSPEVLESSVRHYSI